MSTPQPVAPPPPFAAPVRTNTLALIGFIGVFFVPILGIVLGVLGRRQIAQTGESGDGLARAAFILGVIFTAFQVLFFIVWFAMFFTAMSQSPFFR